MPPAKHHASFLRNFAGHVMFPKKPSPKSPHSKVNDQLKGVVHQHLAVVVVHSTNDYRWLGESMEGLGGKHEQLGHLAWMI